jgi:hypothetical protein
MRWLGANPSPQVMGHEMLPGKVHYLRGNDPTQWRTHIPTYTQVYYQAVYPGVDMVFYGRQGQLEYDIVLAPGVNPQTIRLGFEGVEDLDVDAQGDLVLRIGDEELRLQKPVIYQEVEGGRQEVNGGYVLHAPRQVGFQVVAYDMARALVIDPVLNYSSYLGGSDTDEAYSIAVDAEGAAYVAGETTSVDFPTVEPVQPGYGGNFDAFIAKVSPDGTALVYATYLGGSRVDVAYAIAVDMAGYTYVAGATNSPDFPTIRALQPTYGGINDAFVVKLSPDGASLVYATYLGGSEGDLAFGLAVDTLGAAYVTGSTDSLDFPTKNPLQPTLAGGNPDVFVTKIHPQGSVLVYSTYLGGKDSDQGNGIAVDGLGNAYVTGSTFSADFPTTAGAFQITPPPLGADNGFVTKVNPTGSALVYSTYLGGRGPAATLGIAIDIVGYAYVIGGTNTPDFPATTTLQRMPVRRQDALGGDPLLPRVAFFEGSPVRNWRVTSRISIESIPVGCAGTPDAFVAKLTPDGAALVYATRLGGSDCDVGQGIALDVAGHAYVTGLTLSDDFPAVNAIQTSSAGSFDAFVAKLDPSGATLVYSTYLGGSGGETGYSIAVDADGAVWVAGGTDSRDFPLAAPLQRRMGGLRDAFVAKLSETPGPDTVSILKAVFAARRSRLSIVATSTAAPAAQLTVTVPGCVSEAPMRFSDGRYRFMTNACSGLDGKTATVQSSFGGMATATIR